MRPLILASLLALAAVTAIAAPALRFKIGSCAEATHACAAIGRPLYPTFDACQTARQHMMTHRTHMLVCAGSGHSLPTGYHQR
jgi:hypothetical protein